MRKKAFTLAEVLITLGIIGVVAAMTIPTLMNNTQNNEFKTAYKKAYAEINQAFMQALQEQSITPRDGGNALAATASEWDVIQSAFKAVKICDVSHLNDCWAAGDTLWNRPAVGAANSFIDASGRSWSEYSILENMFLLQG